jgi:tetratricopeptide (TPR) repeat protein
MNIPFAYITHFAILFLILSTGCASLQTSLFMKDPLTAEEHNNLGVIYEREGKHELAVREYKKAISNDNSLITPYINLGNVYFKEGEFTEAEKSYKKALELDEASLEASNNLASLYIETDAQYEEGLDYMIAATSNLEIIPPYALDTIGVLYLKIGNKAEAEKFLIKACNDVTNDQSLTEEIRADLWQLGINKRCGG